MKRSYVPLVASYSAVALCI